MAQFGGNWTNNPQMQQGRPYKWDPVQKKYVSPTGQTGQAGGGGFDYWENMLRSQFNTGAGGAGTNVKAPQMSGNYNQYLQGGASAIPVQNVTAQNVTAPQMSQDWQKYVQAGTQNINAAGLQDTGALLRSYDPILAQQQAEGFAGAAQRAGKTGMWGSPYATALGSQVRQTENQRANIANQYLYQASEAAANRQLQAEIQNRQNQLQAAGLSADQARAQAQMELSASQGNQQAGLQAGISNQGANLQAQLAQRTNQLQAAGLSADQAYRQAQLELSASQGNQQAGLQQGSQALQAYGLASDRENALREGALNRFVQQYGDIQSPDDLWGYISGLYGQGGYQMPQYGGTYQSTPPNFSGLNQNMYFNRGY